MAESMKGLHRSHRCTEVSNQNIGETVTVMGWVQKRRNLGSLIFIDLRDRSGILQLVFNEESVGKEGYEKAERLRSEYVIAVTGKVEKRSAAVNESLKTGDIEVIATDIRILSEAETPPFQIEENSQTKDEVRLKYRYLDLRRPDIPVSYTHLDVYKRQERYTQDFWNTRMFIARQGLFPMTKKVENWCFITTWILII